jgi:hypothetical protein
MREFRGKFTSNEECFEYLIQCKWPDGFVCSKCSGKSVARISSRYVVRCRACRHQFYPMAGTVMHRSHVPIQEWFWAAYLVATHTPGISALQLQRQLGIGSYDTAWHMLHRLRKGMVNESRTRLHGLIEADETHVGGPAKGKTGRGVGAAKDKTLVAGTVEVLAYTDQENRRKERAGRVRLQVIQDASETSTGAFVRANVEPGSRLRTDGWKGYSDAALKGYKHSVRIIGSPERAHQRAPHIHRVFSNLKTWLNGTHHGVQPKYLQSYLDAYSAQIGRSFRSKPATDSA